MLGTEHSDTASSYNNIGNVCYDKGDYYRALEYYLKAYNVFKKKLGADHPDTKMAEENIELVKSMMIDN